MSLLGFAGNIASTLIGGRLGQLGAKEQMRFNAEQARLNREFQREMSSTAHQRQVADLRKAGLNPILSASQGGASTPSGAQASTSLNPNEVFAHSAADLALKAAQTDKLRTEADAQQYAAEVSRLQAEGLGWLEDQFKSSALSSGAGAAGVIASILFGKKVPDWLFKSGGKKNKGKQGSNNKEMTVTGGSAKDDNPHPKDIAKMTKLGYRWSKKYGRWMKR